MSEPTPPKRRPGRPKTSPLDRKAQQAESKRRTRLKKAHVETFLDHQTHAALKYLAELEGKSLRAIVDAALAIFLRENRHRLPEESQGSVAPGQEPPR